VLREVIEIGNVIVRMLCYNKNMGKNVLIVEDDEGIQTYIKELLLDNGYAVEIASDGVEALNKIKRVPPELIVLDLGLPNLSGESVVTEVRKKYPDLPVVILTARDNTSDIVHGLELGADDYITKPFAGEVLVARIHARLRAKEGENSVLSVGDLEMNTKTLEVKRGDKVIPLSQKEFQLLQYLLSNKGRVLTREMILNRIWLYSSHIETRVVDVYMGYLRKKIDADHDHKLIHSVRGFGYMIKE